MADLMIKGLTPNVVGTPAATGVSETKESKDAMTVFASMMCRTDGTTASNDGLLTVAKAGIKTADPQITPDTFKNKVVKEQQAGTGKEISPEVQDKLQALNDKIKEAVMEKYDITEEELEEAMQVLGLEYIELLLPENLVKLSVEITGAADSLELLSSTGFNELYGMMQDFSAEITAELDIPVTPETVETFAEILNPTELPDTEVSETVLPEMEMTAAEDIEGSADSLDNEEGYAELRVAPEETTTEADKEPADQVQSLVESGIEKGTVEVRTTAAEKTESDRPVSETEIKAEAETETSDKNDPVIRVAAKVDEKDQQQNTEEKNDPFFPSRENKTAAKETKLETGTDSTNNVAAFDNFRNVAPEAPIEAAAPLSQTETLDIIRQISDYMRLNVTGSETSIEMQLNPENLGKVGINLSVREGAVTAQIAVENEAVRKALESQMVTLRENMSNQGLKVEAVEVTIASHEFEQNLENGAPTGQEQQQQSEKQARTTRNITASDLGSIEEMPEDQQLAAKIMKDNGNSMDITA